MSNQQKLDWIGLWTDQLEEIGVPKTKQNSRRRDTEKPAWAGVSAMSVSQKQNPWGDKNRWG